jgi:hypothetical protein
LRAASNIAGRWTSTVILADTVVLEGTAFRWLVTDGLHQQLTVSHPAFGTKTQPLTRSPDRQARDVGRTMMHGSVKRSR